MTIKMMMKGRRLVDGDGDGDGDGEERN